MYDYKLDWKANHDPASRNFRAAPMTSSTRVSRHWYVPGRTLNQGREGACVGHGVTNALRAAPIKLKVPDPQQLAFGMYYGSRRIDEWAGESYDGTSVNAGCKLARELGLIKEYRWAFGTEEIKQTVLEVAPVVIGIVWYESMYQTNPDGVVDKLEGPIVGGHCLLVTGYNNNVSVGDYKGPAFRWENSWGDEYGRAGKAWVPVDIFNQLIVQDGEAAVLIP